MNLKLQHGLPFKHPVQEKMGKEDEEQPMSSLETLSEAARPVWNMGRPTLCLIKETIKVYLSQ